MNNLLLSFATGVVFSALLTWDAIRTFPRVGLLDFPERYGLKRERIPYPGGIIFVILALLFFIFRPEFWFLFFAVLILGGISFYDDRKILSPQLRLFIHIALAIFVFANGIQIAFVGNPFAPGTSINLTLLPFMSLILTVTWIVVIQNAMNWFDGISGLSVGVSGVGFLALGLFGLLRPEVAWEFQLPEFLMMSFYLCGMCVGAFFLFWKGKIILGDTGSQVLGFLLAILSIFAGTKIATTLLVLGLPILDAIFVVFRRVIIEKKSPLQGDQKHLHHNLANKIGIQNATLVLIIISGILGGIAVFFTGITKLISLGIVAILVLILNIWSGNKQSKMQNTE